MDTVAERAMPKDEWRAVIAAGAGHPDAEVRSECRAAVGRAVAGAAQVVPLEAFAACVATFADDPLEPLELDEGSVWASWALLHGSSFPHLRISGRAVLTEDFGTLFTFRKGAIVGRPADAAAQSEKQRSGWFLARRFDGWRHRVEGAGSTPARLVERKDSEGGGLAIRIRTPARWRCDRIDTGDRNRIAIGPSDLFETWFVGESGASRWASDGERLESCGARIERTSSEIVLSAAKPEAIMRLMARLEGGDHLVLGEARPVGYLVARRVATAASAAESAEVSGPVSAKKPKRRSAKETGSEFRFCRAFELAPADWVGLRGMRPLEVPPELRLAIARWCGVPRAWASRDLLERMD